MPENLTPLEAYSLDTALFLLSNWARAKQEEAARSPEIPIAWVAQCRQMSETADALRLGLWAKNGGQPGNPWKEAPRA